MSSLTLSDTSIDDRTDFITKLDLAETDGRYIAGYANIANIVDSQDELVTLDALKQAWEQFRQDPNYALLMLRHENIPIAKVVFEEVTDSGGRVYKSGVDERGLFIVAKLREDNVMSKLVWSDIEKGKLRGFSIGGKNLNPQPIQCDDNRCYRILDSLELYEVSIVSRPANPASIFTILKCEPQMKDTLQLLAKATESFIDSTIHEGIVKVSKTPDEEGVYELYACTEKGTTLCRELSTYLASIPSITEFKIVDTLDEKKEYVTLLDLALLTPFSGELTRDEYVGSNLSHVSDKPPMGKPSMTEKEEKDKDQSKLDESEQETEIDEEEEETKKKEFVGKLAQLRTLIHQVSKLTETSPDDSSVAIAPLTIETLTADLAQIVELLQGSLQKSVEVKSMNPLNSVEAIKEVKKEVSKEQETQTQPTENKVVPVAPAPITPQPEPVVETPAVQPTQPVPVAPEPQPTVEAPKPVQEQKPEPTVEQPVTPTPVPAIQTQPVMQTRGVQVTVEQMNQTTGFDLASLTRVSQKEIEMIRERTEQRRI